MQYRAELPTLRDGGVDVLPLVLRQKVLVHPQVGCEVIFPRVQVAVEAAVRDHAGRHVGKRAGHNWGIVDRPLQVISVTR